MKINRNAPCPCGSGLKYKHCCLRKSETGSPRNKFIAVLAWLAIAGITLFGIVNIIERARNLDDPSGGSRVWSEEHQHWH